MEEKPEKKPKLNSKQKKIISIFGVVIAVIILLAAAYFIFGGKDLSEPIDDSSDAPFDTSNLPELSPEDIGLEVIVRDDNLALKFELTKADDIKTVEYTIEYEAKIEDIITNQGIFGEMNIGKDGITKTDFREFGTCSAGRCRYDDVVSDVTINLKVVKKDGKAYSVTKIVKLDSSDN